VFPQYQQTGLRDYLSAINFINAAGSPIEMNTSAKNTDKLYITVQHKQKMEVFQ
jgi:hypothetical protein